MLSNGSGPDYWTEHACLLKEAAHLLDDRGPRDGKATMATTKPRYALGRLLLSVLAFAAREPSVLNVLLVVITGLFRLDIRADAL